MVTKFARVASLPVRRVARSSGFSKQSIWYTALMRPARNPLTVEASLKEPRMLIPRIIGHRFGNIPTLYYLRSVKQASPRANPKQPESTASRSAKRPHRFQDGASTPARSGSYARNCHARKAETAHALKPPTRPTGYILIPRRRASKLLQADCKRRRGLKPRRLLIASLLQTGYAFARPSPSEPPDTPPKHAFAKRKPPAS